MIQIVEQTFEEKYKMYSKLTKDELIKMLIQANNHLNNNPIQIQYPTYVPKDYNYPKQPHCLHDNCPSCNGTGVKFDGSLCIHHISCNCPKCSPKC